jgi:hypothetical protein
MSSGVRMTGHGALDSRYWWCAMSNKVTPFRHPSPLKAETPIDGRIVFEVGPDRFAMEANGERTYSIKA